MNRIQFHRGPDDDGAFVDPHGNFAMAMRRLAILDVAGGKQPMRDPSGRYTIVYNGEILNAPELRRDLEAAGERFSTDHSDTEVLLRLLVRNGVDALAKLNGMFAFALHDARDRTVLLARDRMGIKPLYWRARGRDFAFASELKSLAPPPIAESDIDWDSAFHYFSLHYVPGRSTILRGIERLEAGHWLRYGLDDGKVEIARWWKPEFRPDRSVPAEEWPVRVRKTLAEAARRWTLSDAPIACSLSGGLDSAAIVGLLARDGMPPRTYTLGFSGSEGRALDERALARAVARKWGTHHTEVEIDADSLLDDLPDMVHAMDEPYAGGLPSWAVFGAMAREVKVGLTGTGGDELFGNYGKWRWLHDSWALRLGGALDARRFRKGFFERVYYFADTDKRGALGPAFADAPDTSDLLFARLGAAGATRDRLAAVDLATQLPEEFLAMTDRFSMAHSLEARPPFLDNTMVDLALTIPAELRSARAGDRFKALLRDAVAPVLPEELLAAPKRGFVVPMAAWLRGRLRTPFERLLGRAGAGVFGPDFARRYVAPHMAGAADHRHKLWAALMFLLWWRLHVDGVSRADLRAELAT
ncbi:MAG: asparagine synthase (glutamine-hydrolyzing) [Tagaea sp.]|nr:asparagine synthase (glutamine-hydrolyzing) [Tagaea sp.]